MEVDVVVVGGGIAGLTAMAYLCKEGYNAVLFEKEDRVGGLVSSFDYKGFTFDGGIRAIENFGVVFPMLRQLGIQVEFLPNIVSLGIGNDVIQVISKESVMDYKNLLMRQFPDNREDIEAILHEIQKIMQYMDVLYGIDNPIFMDIKEDKDYLYNTLLPWLYKFLGTIGKIKKLQMPVDEYLKKFSNNQVMIDIIAQHFFQKTPTSFALSYFSLYLDYKYPKGGTGTLIHKMEEFIHENRGDIRKSTKITQLDPQARIALDAAGNTYHYKKLIWASDLKALYNNLDLSVIQDTKVKKSILNRKSEIADKVGGDSILTTYLTVDMDKSYFEKICTAHFFYTPEKEGLSKCPLSELILQNTKNQIGTNNPGVIYTKDKQAIIDWFKRYYTLTTYEISCPVMRDPALAPEGKTGLIISSLMEYSLVKHISAMGWYEEFKELSQECMIDVLNSTIFPEIKAHKIDSFVSTPLTLQKRTDNSDGAITGWAFTNSVVPAVSSLLKVTHSIRTPIPDIYQAGQWCYSPSGFPISVMTGKFAFDQVKKDLSKK